MVGWEFAMQSNAATPALLGDSFVIFSWPYNAFQTPVIDAWDQDY